MPELRPYQRAFVEAVISDYGGGLRRLLGVAATGSGKTIMAAELCRRYKKRALFLADAQELVCQAAKKIADWSGKSVGVEMGGERACGHEQVVVGTTQSLSRRLEKYGRDDFGLVIVDEAHRNTLGAQAMRVLEHFGQSRVLGITATPFRSDRRQLGDFYEKISYEISLPALIAQRYLSPITIRSVPCPIDLRNVRTVAGDYNGADLGEAIEPQIMELAKLLRDNAPGRRTVAFLPLVRTSKMFAECCRSLGLRAVHVDGQDRSALKSDWQVICNASLLTTGWDEPSVDCVYILRPTKSYVLYSQMVGRGTRLFDGKENLLLLDPLYLSDDLSLVRPARLVASTQQEADALQKRLELEGGDLLGQMERAKADLQRSMLEAAAAARKRASRTVDAIEFALSLNRPDLLEYEPEMRWESAPISEAQRGILVKNGIDADDGRMCKGLASKIIDIIFTRYASGLCTPKQMRFLQRYNYPAPELATFKEASAFIEARLAKFKPKKATIN